MNSHPPNDPLDAPSSSQEAQPSLRNLLFDGKAAADPTADSARQARKAFWVEMASVFVLVFGFLGYAVYLTFYDSSAPATSAKPSTEPNKPEKPAVRATSVAKSGTATPGSNPEIYQRPPRTGIYYTENSQLPSSRREVAGNNGRFCIKLVNGPSASNAGFQVVIVSSLSAHKDGIYVDANQTKLMFDGNGTEMQDSQGTWQTLESKVDTSGLMDECLAAKGVFVRKTSGDYVE
jgi:hypothetical protein